MSRQIYIKGHYYVRKSLNGLVNNSFSSLFRNTHQTPNPLTGQPYLLIRLKHQPVLLADPVPVPPAGSRFVITRSAACAAAELSPPSFIIHPGAFVTPCVRVRVFVRPHVTHARTAADDRDHDQDAMMLLLLLLPHACQHAGCARPFDRTARARTPLQCFRFCHSTVGHAHRRTPLAVACGLLLRL